MGSEDGGLALDIKIDPDKLEAAFVEAVLDTGLGKHITKAVEDALKSQYSMSSVVKQAVNDVIAQEVRRLVTEVHADEIKAHVEKALTKDAIAEMFDRVWTAASRL